jgi:hypothetical protein
MLRDANWEARAVCSRAWLKWLFRAMSVTALLAATAFFFTGSPLLGGPCSQEASPVHGAISAGLYEALPRARFPLCEMGCAAGHARARLRDRRAQLVLAADAQMVLAADGVLMAADLDRMDAGFDPAKNPHRAVAQAAVPLTMSGRRGLPFWKNATSAA